MWSPSSASRDMPSRYVPGPRPKRVSPETQGPRAAQDRTGLSGPGTCPHEAPVWPHSREPTLPLKASRELVGGGGRRGHFSSGPPLSPSLQGHAHISCMPGTVRRWNYPPPLCIGKRARAQPLRPLPAGPGPRQPARGCAARTQAWRHPASRPPPARKPRGLGHCPDPTEEPTAPLDPLGS